VRLEVLGVGEAVADGVEIVYSLRDLSGRFFLTTYIISRRQRWYRSGVWVRVEVRVYSCAQEDT